MTRYYLLPVILAIASGCARLAPDGLMQVTGTATYKERMALPPNAVLEVTLEDVSKADAQAEVVGRARLEQPGNPPFRFAIPLDPSRIDPGRRYAVRARILIDGRLQFITDRSYPVLGEAQRTEVALMLRRIGGPDQASDEPLENTYWKLIRLGDTPVAAAEKQREPHLILHPASRRVSALGGCNRITGSFEREGDRLTFGRMAGTLMACPDGMATEKLFIDTLERTGRFRIARRHLELLDAAGNVLADLEAVYLR
jgi:putative lipoprotein